MNLGDTSLQRVTLFVAGSAAVLTLVTGLVGGPYRALGAAVGGVVAVANWYGMRWLGERLRVANDRGRAIWGGLLAVKMAAILGIVWGILATGLVDPAGFSAGLSSLVVGVLLATLHLASSPTTSSEDTSSVDITTPDTTAPRAGFVGAEES